jgi:hypothetical protein
MVVKMLRIDNGSGGGSYEERKLMWRSHEGTNEVIV